MSVELIISAMSWVGIAITGYGVVGLVLKPVRNRRDCGLIALGNAMALPSATLHHDITGSAIDTAAVIWFGWLWWKSGGGDDTKKRLRELGKKFEGQRRTAPQAA